MRYLIVIDPNSQVGRIYADSCDLVATGGLPCIDCSEMDAVGPYIACTRDSKRPDVTRQSLWIPHSAVVLVVGYEKEAERPIGFSAK